MRRDWYISIIAGLASFLAIAPLSVIFDQRAWLLSGAAVLVTLVVTIAVLARALHAPRWLQPVVTAATVSAYLTHRFGEDLGLYGLIPTPGVFRYFGSLLSIAGQETREVGVPVPDRVSLQFVTLLGVGVMALLVDFLAVTLRKPALAGLPMLATYSVPVALLQTDVPILLTLLVIFGYLWLLVADHTDRVRGWGRRVSGDGTSVDPWEPSPIAASGRRVAVIGLAAALAIPVYLPGQSTGLIERFGTLGVTGLSGERGGGSGEGTVVNPITMLHGNLVRDRTIEMVRVKSDNPKPGYLRIAVADEISEDGFKPSGPYSSQSLANLPDLSPESNVAHENHEAEIEIKNLDSLYLPLYARPTSVDMGPTRSVWAYDPVTDVAYSPRRSNIRAARYEQSYSQFTFTAAELRRAAALDPTSTVVQVFAQVPENDYVTNLVARTLAGKGTQYDQVLAILDSLSAKNGFQYSLSTEPGTSGVAIVDFLENKRGYCEQYASAMAWMVRAAGYPARVATGFTQGTRSISDPREWSMTNYNLHAWVEVYFVGYGWVPFDPTPSANVPGAVALPWAPDPNQVDDSTSADTGDDAASAAGPEVPAPGDARLRDTDAAPVDSALSATAADPRPRYAVGVLFLLAVALLPASIRLLTRRRRIAATRAEHIDAGRQAHTAWAEFADLLVDYRLSADPSETPRSLAVRVTTEGVHSERTLHGEAAEGAILLAKVEEHARYAKRSHTVDGLSKALIDVRDGLRTGAGWNIKVVAVLMPPSIMRRWRRGVIKSTRSWAEWLGRIQRQWAPRHLLRRD
ncbi:MAG: transglutaminase domain-containing protein [Longispora sp.]|nr:transglutaminase domain-containing protein [Longispora sp. (in: high G+C Gram-positive bacteria)]